MRTFIRFLIAFLALTCAVAVATGVFGIQFAHAEYWDHHGLLFLLFITAFPRLTLLFSSVASGGLLWWLSWLFAPRLLVAVLATLAYWYQNPFLVIVSWLVALGGESSEKYVVIRRSRPRGRVRSRARAWDGSTPAGPQEGYEHARWVKAEQEPGRK